jgi:hypothetical protein
MSASQQHCWTLRQHTQVGIMVGWTGQHAHALQGWGWMQQLRCGCSSRQLTYRVLL